MSTRMGTIGSRNRDLCRAGSIAMLMITLAVASRNSYSKYTTVYIIDVRKVHKHKALVYLKIHGGKDFDSRQCTSFDSLLIYLWNIFLCLTYIAG